MNCPTCGSERWRPLRASVKKGRARVPVEPQAVLSRRQRASRIFFSRSTPDARPIRVRWPINRTWKGANWCVCPDLFHGGSGSWNDRKKPEQYSGLNCHDEERKTRRKKIKTERHLSHQSKERR